jgi:hypothetical protein
MAIERKQIFEAPNRPSMNRLHAFSYSVWNFKKTRTPQQDAVENNVDVRTRTRLLPAAGTLVQQMQTQQLKAEVQRLKTALAEANSLGTQVTAGHPAYIHTYVDTTCIYIHLYIVPLRKSLSVGAKEAALQAIAVFAYSYGN